MLTYREVMAHTFSWQSQSHRMSKDNDGLCATAEAFVYVAMTRPMVFLHQRFFRVGSRAREPT